MQSTRLYVGLTLDCTGRREVFRATPTPTQETHGQRFAAVIGPLHGADGTVCQSLGGVDFGRDGEPWGNPYRRVCEAELALEQML